MDESKALAYSASEIDSILGSVSTKADKTEINALESNITSSTTIKAYVNALSKGHYVSFYTSSSKPSDAPLQANSFVEIFVYSAQSAMVRVTPFGTTADNRIYTMTKSQGNWRSWCVFTGEAVE